MVERTNSILKRTEKVKKDYILIKECVNELDILYYLNKLIFLIWKNLDLNFFLDSAFYKIAYISKVKIELLPGGSNYKKNFK